MTDTTPDPPPEPDRPAPTSGADPEPAPDEPAPAAAEPARAVPEQGEPAQAAEPAVPAEPAPTTAEPAPTTAEPVPAPSATEPGAAPAAAPESEPEPEPVPSVAEPAPSAAEPEPTRAATEPAAAAAAGATAATAAGAREPEPAPPAPTADERPDGPVHRTRRTGTGPLRVLAILVILGGLILSAAGVVTWIVVTDQLSDEKIVVSDDADNFAGDDVDGPFTAYAEAEVIQKHALEASDGLTYAELDQDDPRRETVMTASFLRASLFTSVVAFGVAAFAFGLGILLIIVGWALLRINKSLRATS
jgi:hypothetical protein